MEVPTAVPPPQQSLDSSNNNNNNNNNTSHQPAAPPRDDPRVEFIRRLVLRTFSAVKPDKLNRLLATDSVATQLFEFLHVPDARLLLFTDHGSEFSGTLKVYSTPPPHLFGAGASGSKSVCVLYFVKAVKAAVSLERVHEELLTGTLERDALESLAHILHEILIPLIGNPRNQRLWPEMVTASVINNVHGFFSSLQITVGQTRGATCLPLPWDQILTENAPPAPPLQAAVVAGSHASSHRMTLTGSATAVSTSLMKDQVHALEGCLITWTKQIKNILKQDPEVLLNRKAQQTPSAPGAQQQSHHHHHPGPLEELAFWAAKARNLNSIFAQLQSDSVRKVLQYLDASKSTYNVPFAKLCKEVFLARAEANDNLHFLTPLTPWFQRLASASVATTIDVNAAADGDVSSHVAAATAAFTSIRELFRPICHALLLIWKCSRFYNTPSRLVVLVRQICNEIIRCATRFLSGATLFALIERDALETANAMLRTCLQVGAAFKSVYFDYKARSSTDVPANPWRVQNNALFVRLDAFLERCHDVLELTQTIDQFQKLATLEIGGTKGKTLTTSVHQIFNDFRDTLLVMRSVPYDLMDLDAKAFEDDFYAFRSRNKELERRLASVISQAFDDAKTIHARFKCLDCFEDLLDRAIIKNELERKYTALLASYATDLHVVQQLFIEHREHPPIPHNLPPFAGAVTWSRGLAERIRFPMDKLRQIAPRVVMDREDAKDAIKLYTNVLAMLQEFEVQTVKKWGVSIETSSKAKLKLPLIRRDLVHGTTTTTTSTTTTATDNSSSSGVGAQQLVEMAAMAAGNGVVASSSSGGASASSGPTMLFVNFDAALVQLLREVKYFLLLGIEIPEDALAIYKKAEVFRRQTGNLALIVDLYNTIHATLLPVERPLVKTYLDRMDQALTKGIKALNWKSHGIDVFLKESMTDVNDANALLSQLRAHQTRVTELLAQWLAPPLLFERKNKPLAVAEFEELQRALCQQKYQQLKDGGNEIHRLLKDAIKVLRVSTGSPDWRAYVDYVSARVEDGLTAVVVQSLTHLRDQLDPRRIEHDDLSALLEVELDLYGKGVVYFPPIAATATRNGVRDVVVRRIEAILHAATVFKRLDTSDGSYLKEMREHVEVQRLIADISSFLDQNEAKCNALRLELAKYEYLWTTDLAAMFSTFLATAWRPLPPTSSAFRYADAIPSAASPAPASASSSSSATATATAAAGASSSSTTAKKSVLMTVSPVASSSSSSTPPLPPLPAQLLDLPKFEAQIHHFLALQNEISDAKAARDVGFVRVNALPVKQALATWVTKWIYLFTQYLHDRVVAQLAWLDQFLVRVASGLDLHELDGSAAAVAAATTAAAATPSNEQHRVETADEKAALMSCMQHIRDVRRLMREELLVNFAGLKDVVTLLKTNGIALDLSYVGSVNVLAFLEQAPLRWEATVNKAFKKKELITPLQTQMVESIRHELSELSRRVLALRDDFARVAPFAMPLSAVDDAYVALDASHDALARLEADAARLAELEDMFELAPSRHDALLALRRDLVQLKQLWDLAALQDAVYARWQTLPWLDLDTDALMDEADALERVLRGAVAPAAIARVREWPVYLELTQRMAHMVVVLPLVKSLHSPAMRERHWKSLMGLTKRHFDLAPATASASASASSVSSSASSANGSNVASALRLEEVLRLELHRFVNEVNELVEVASREFKIEQQLQAIETAWNAFTLEFLPFKTAGGSSNTVTPPPPKIHEADDEDDDDDDDGAGGAGAGGGASMEGGDVMILKPPTAILECLEDHQLQLQSMAAMGKFVAYFRDRVFDWQLRLGNVDVVLKLWLALQRQWCSLESIFLSAAGDLQASLPQEFTRFTHVDAEMRELLQDARAAPSVLVACCQREGRELVLRDLATELEHCQRALHQYLDAKKDVFPRFYFVSNASLLEILSNGNVPPRIQPHVANCFDGIKAFEFDKLSANHSSSDGQQQLQPSRRRSSALQQQQQQLQRYVAQAMVSKEGEVVRFLDALVLHGAVEQWFNDLVRVMQDTLRERLRDALEASALWGVDTTRVAWSLERAAQLALLASQIVWTEEVEAALEELESGTEDALKKYADVSTVRLEELIRVVQGALSALDRQKVITLITVDVHARDVVQALLTKRVTSSLDFAWQSQLRYYAPAKAKDVVIKICDFRAFYSYEYTGNCGRLVITPLTDRCYVTLTTALRLCLGGAPAGPAGTGKTETTKDLARGLGLQCYVFNCSDQMNYRTMADIFKGLAATGAWGCFDEFNRISVEVLSVVATQVKTVLDALVPLAAGLHRLVTACSGSGTSTSGGGGGSSSVTGGSDTAALAASASSGSLPNAMTGTCEFFGKTIALLPSVGLFITMNPGYAGRAELPENLKALFRSCAMIRPDLQPICENMLMAEGFLRARALSVKFVTLYELSRELLSKQTHYDWGLRAVKSVLLVAGALRRAAEPHASSEERVLLQVLRDFNTPRILPADYPVFLGLLRDLFPGHDVPPRRNDELHARGVEVCRRAALQPEDGFLRKVLELDDVLAVRHSAMLIGPAGCGKTTIWTTLAATHNLGLPRATTVFETVNPKAISADELYGFMTLDNDWRDGVLSSVMRAMAKETAPFSEAQRSKWVVLDGDIDAGWIESMNTVMDDNKVLTLVSNERIPLTPSMRLVFEIHSLQHATPATVSRAGIVYVNEQEIGWAPYVESWIQRRAGGSSRPAEASTPSQSQSEAGVLASLVVKYIEPLFALLRDHKLAPIVPMPPIAMVKTLCDLLDGLLDSVPASAAERSPEMLENAFLYCAMWAFGGPLDSEKGHDHRKVFATHFKALAKFKNVSDAASSTAGPSGGATAASGSGAGSGAASGSGGTAAAAAALLQLNVFDVCFDVARNEFVPWSDRVAPLVVVGDVPFHQLIVPTVESTRLHALMDLLLGSSASSSSTSSVSAGASSSASAGAAGVSSSSSSASSSSSQSRGRRPVLLVGSSGSGKTAVITEHLRNLDSDDDELSTAHVVLHHFMDARALQLRLESFVEKRSGRVYGPLQNRRLVYFLDDLNMPATDAYGTQTPIALLRQLVDYGAWFDRQDLSVKKILQDVQLVAAMNHKAGAFTINPRLQRHFATFAVATPARSDLSTIFSTLLSAQLQGFADKLKRLAPALVTASIELYQDVRANFVPTAAKFHYVFSLRELSAVFQGLSLARAESYLTSTVKLTRLWLHECFRVFSDRMASASEVQRFADMALEQVKKHFEDDPTELFAAPLVCAGFIGNPNTNSSSDTSGSSSATTTGAASNAVANYVPVADKAQLTASVEAQLRLYNESHPVMSLVLFDQALEHVTRIVRVLSHPRGHALLIGVGGSGKQSLTRLAAFICGFALTSLGGGGGGGSSSSTSTTSSSQYAASDLRDDLKEIYRRAGVRPAKPLVLLVTDAQVLDDRFLVVVNDVLRTGYVPDLFTPEEMDAMVAALRTEAKTRGVPDTKEHLQAFFLERVRANLHVVLAFSPVGSTLRVRCRYFPSLMTCCAIDWFHAWPKEALLDVSMQFLKDADLDLATQAIAENVCHTMAEMHLSVTTASAAYERQCGRYNYVTPTSFLELIRFYRKLLARKRDAQRVTIARLHVGLATLKKTATDVAALQDELKKTMKKVEERKRATDALLEQMGKQRGDAEAKQRRADEERAKAARAAEIASAIEAQASVELAIAKPALDAAQQAVNCLNKASLTELKSMGKPPAGVEKVTAAVLMLTKNESKNLSWDNAKKMMAKVDVFKQSLETFDKENIPADVIARVEPILEDPNFNYDKMKSKSVAAANLCVWVVNIVAFHHVYTRVKPLMDTLEDARRAKSDADSELATVQKLVAEVEAQLAALQASFREATNEKAKVEAEAHACQERLSLAERLVNGLASENERWSREIDVLQASEMALIGDTLLAAGFVSYIGAFNASFRAQLWRHTWLPDIVTREIPISLGGGGAGGGSGGGGSGGGDGKKNDDDDGHDVDGRGVSDAGRGGGGASGGGAGGGSGAPAFSGVDPVEMLSDSSAIAQWMNEGLPADRISIENGCIITSCERWPLLVDPQLQGLMWLRARDYQLEPPPEAPQSSPAATAGRRSSHVEDPAELRRQSQSSVQLPRKNTSADDLRSDHEPPALAATASSASLQTTSTTNTTTATTSSTALSPLVILHTSQKAWVKSLKTAISTGQSVILENLGEVLDAALEPVLMRRVYRKGRNWFLHFAAEEIEFDPRFRLFLHTKLPNPHYRPEILAYCTLIDFSVTERGLEDQLLASVVNLEQPILEKHKQRLQQEFNGYQIQLRQLETQLLERLSNAPDDILSDVPLIEGLEQTKRTANDVALALIKGKEAEKEINLAREVYRPVANEASMLYFLMGQMCKVNHMYRYSLESFMTFFYVAMQKVPAPAVSTSSSSSEPAAAAAASPPMSGEGFLSSAAYAAAFDRVPLLKEALRWTVFVMVSRGLFEEHKLIFLTQLVLQLLRRGVIGAHSGYDEDAARFLLQGPKAVGPENPITWLSETQWQSLQALIQLEPFERFVADLEESEARFKEWYNAPYPETEKLPLDWRELDKSAPFLKLLVVRAMRPDRLTQAVSNFIAATLPNGAQYLNCDAQLNSYGVLKSAFEESTPWTPTYFVLSPGTDVVADVDKLAVQEHERIKGVDYHNIALGQGQEAIAMQKLQLSVENGHWIILNNVHLMPKWLLELDKWLEQLAKASKTASYASLSLNLASAAAAAATAATTTATSNSNDATPPPPARSRSIVASPGGLHPSFRLFITSDPSTAIPIGVLERSIKLTNEPPTGLKANVKRAFCCFPKSEVDELEPRTRVILFGMCYFHSLMLERKKFGTQGFNMVYPFAASDLVSSSIVLRNYMDNVPARVPWADLRYLFGEIMYGGHIVNDSDRLVAATYLSYFLRDDLLDELSMVPYPDDSHGGGSSKGDAADSGGGADGGASGGGGGGATSDSGGGGGGGAMQRREFLAPKLSAGFDRILDHIEHALVNDSPTAFGLHPNAEVAFRTEHGERLVQTILQLTRRDDDGGGGSMSSSNGDNSNGASGGKDHHGSGNSDSMQMVAEGVLQDILENYREFRFDVHELFFKSLDVSSSSSSSSSAANGRSGSVSAAMSMHEEMDPFQNVLLQECERMNVLLDTMTRSLVELEMGFRGEVTLTEAMETLQDCLFFERIPKAWESVAYPSRRSLAPWLANLQQRIAQLQEWSAQAPELPVVLWLPGLFNPQSFLTAVLQTAARKNSLELDKLSVLTDITKRQLEAIDAPSRDGQYIHGLSLEGARWDIGNGMLESSQPKEMYVPMPVMNCRAVLTARKDLQLAANASGGGGSSGAAASAGGGAGAGAGSSNVYECPVYKTQQRGPTFVFVAQLRSKHPPAKWVLAGVALLMEVV